MSSASENQLYILILTQGMDGGQHQLKKPFYDHSHFPEKITDQSPPHKFTIKELLKSICILKTISPCRHESIQQ